MSSIGGRSGSFVVPGGLVELASTSVVDEVSITDLFASGTANVVPNISVVCDGSPVLVELYSPMAYPDPFSAASWFSLGLVYDGARTGSGNGHWAYQQNDGTGYDLNPLHLSMRMTPTAGVHTFGVNGYCNVNSARIGGDTSQRGMDAIQFRVSKIVEQGTSLKPFWTPPVVQELPSNPTVGDMVIYAADITNGVYWNLYYDGIGTYPWKFIGGSPLSGQAGTNAQYGTGVTTSSKTAADLSGPYVTVPLAGDYKLQGSAMCLNSLGGNLGGCFFWIASDGATGWSFTDFSITTSATDGASGSISGARLRTGLAASTQIAIRYATSNELNTAQFWNRYLSATPVRVKAA